MADEYNWDWEIDREKVRLQERLIALAHRLRHAAREFELAAAQALEGQAPPRNWRDNATSGIGMQLELVAESEARVAQLTEFRDN